MAIFSNSVFTPVVEDTESYPWIKGDSNSAYEIAAEGYRDLHKLVAGMYVSDILIEQAVSEGADAEPLVEGTIKSFIDTAVAKIRALWNKIKDWFKKVIDRIKIRFASSKEFVKKYEDRILEKAKNAKGFKITKHDIKNTDVSGKGSEWIGKIFDYTKAEVNNKHEDFNKDAIQKLDSTASSISELKQNFVKMFIGDEKVGQSIGSSDVSMMVIYCKGVESAISSIKNLATKNDKAFSGTINDINNSKIKDDSERENATRKVQYYNFALKIMQDINTMSVEVINKINNEFISILRALMLYKPAKESYTPDDELMKESSIFESALNMI